MTRRFLGEGLLIVVSILLAFFIDRSYESFRERGEERVVLDGLRGDFVANLESLDGYVARYQILLERNLAAADLLASDRRAMPSDSLAGYLRVLYTGGSFDPRSSTLAQAESSGRADLLRDAQLRTLLSEWKADRDDAADSQAGLEEWRNAEVWPLLADLGVAPPRSFSRPDSVPSPPGLTLRTVRASGLEARLRTYGLFVAVNQSDLVELRDATDAVVRRLDQLLAR